jgi:sigma-B regulation protein RsbU (phosphoserine phosphatase)
VALLEKQGNAGSGSRGGQWMKILIAEDDRISLLLLGEILREWNYEVVAASDGLAAWEALQRPGAPQLAILDWIMPALDGVEVCRKVRENAATQGIYVILLSANNQKIDLLTGLRAGANDYVTKPFDREELQVRLQVGARVVELQQSLAERVKELQAALAHVKQLQGILPICSYCKKVRGDEDYWQQVDDYIGSHSEAQCSHSICPDCFAEHWQSQFPQMVYSG